MVTYQQPVDETNKEVQNLLKVGISGMDTLEKCIEAIEKYGTACAVYRHNIPIQEHASLFHGASIQPVIQEDTNTKSVS